MHTIEPHGDDRTVGTFHKGGGSLNGYFPFPETAAAIVADQELVVDGRIIFNSVTGDDTITAKNNISIYVSFFIIKRCFN